MTKHNELLRRSRWRSSRKPAKGSDRSADTAASHQPLVLKFLRVVLINTNFDPVYAFVRTFPGRLLRIRKLVRNEPLAMKYVLGASFEHDVINFPELYCNTHECSEALTHGWPVINTNANCVVSEGDECGTRPTARSRSESCQGAKCPRARGFVANSEPCRGVCL